jgi:sugar phosphate permease
MVMFLIVNYADRANIGVALPLIKKEFSLTNVQAGALASFFFLGYLFTQIPAGLIMSRVGARLMVALSLMGFSICTFLVGTSPGPSFMKWSRIGLGLCEGPAGVGGGALLKAWYPPKEQGTAWGIYSGAGYLANTMVPPIAAFIMVRWGWRMIFYSFAVPGILLAIAWYIFVRSKPEESRSCNTAEREYILQSAAQEKSGIDRQEKSMGWIDSFIRVRRGMKAIQTQGQVFRSWNIWADAIIFFCILTAQGGMLVWIPSYLVNERHLSIIRMGIIAALPFCGNTLGFLFGGWASDRFWLGRRKPMMFLASISGVILLYLLANAPANQAILGILLFFTGFTTSIAMPNYLAYPMGLTNRKTFPTALALVSTVGILGGFSTSIVTGYIVDVFKSYTPVFYYFGLAVIMTFVFALTMVEPLQTVGAESDH